MESALSWRNAPSETIRDQIFGTTGIHWLELLRLSYFNPTRFAVVDAMHNLFLNDLQHHCRNIWGMDAGKKSQPKVVPHDPERQLVELQKGVAALRAQKLSALTDLHFGYVAALAISNNIRLVGQPMKKDYAKALITWVSW